MVSHAKVVDKLTQLTPLIKLIQETVGLDKNNAKTVAYYAIATYALAKLKIFPILSIYGPAGTGKTTLLDILGQLSFEPRKLDGKSSRAILRDNLEQDTTALIDEADKVYEPWLINRYSRQSSFTDVNRELQKGWKGERLNLFGATVLHRRRPFKDPAVLSRSILITTRRKTIYPYEPQQFQAYKPLMAEISSRTEWENLNPNQGHRIEDAWEPLVFPALWVLNDQDWFTIHADKQMSIAKSDLSLGQEEEPTMLVFSALLATAVEDLNSEPLGRVLIAKVTNTVEKMDRDMTPWQIGQICRELGFETKKEGGKQYVRTGGREKLVTVGRNLGIQDEWLDAQRV